MNHKWKVYYLSNIYILDKFSGSCSVCCEYSSTVTIRVRVDYFDCIIKSISRKSDQHWTKNLLFVASHVWLNKWRKYNKQSNFVTETIQHYRIKLYLNYNWKTINRDTDCNICQDGGTNEVALFITRYNDRSTIKNELSAFFHTRFNYVTNPILSFWRDDWSEISIWDMACKCNKKTVNFLNILEPVLT